MSSLYCKEGVRSIVIAWQPVFFVFSVDTEHRNPNAQDRGGSKFRPVERTFAQQY